MCGLTGVMAGPTSRVPQLDDAVRRMCDAIVHRGPDDSGVWTDQQAGVGLGFRRLSIIDLSIEGHQPMSSRSGRFSLVFNGEVYNHGKLRAELEGAGWRFRGHSDTEVIAASFERWGVSAAVPRFTGMFAIAAWDAQERCLWLVRDRLGKKPLYYYHRNGLLTFGSELKALAAGPAFDRTIDPNALSAYLKYLYVPAPLSIYQHVKKLMPGHMIVVKDPTAALPASLPYWSLADVAAKGVSERRNLDEHEAVDQLDVLLSEAVRMRMEADVPLGALLSGGIDSSTVVSLMQAASDRPVKTFSIGFTVTEHDESKHAANIARHLGTDHTQLVVGPEEALSVIPGLPTIFDEPLADPSQIPTYLVSGLARHAVTVALTGDGGDELFAGYHRYLQGAQMINRLAHIPMPVRALAGAAVSAVPERTWDKTYGFVSPFLPSQMRYRLAGEKAHKLARLMRQSSSAGMYQSLLSAWPATHDLLHTGNGQESNVEQTLAATADFALLDRMMLTDQATYLPDDLLAKVDRASMAVSLEVRVPLLDHRVVEFAWRMPRSLLIRNGVGKWLLRQVLYRRVPPALVDRPKVGFTVPLAAWLRGPLRTWASDLLNSKPRGEHVLRMEVVQREWTRFLRGADSSALALWAVLVFEAWRLEWADRR